MHIAHAQLVVWMSSGLLCQLDVCVCWCTEVAVWSGHLEWLSGVVVWSDVWSGCLEWLSKVIVWSGCLEWLFKVVV